MHLLLDIKITVSTTIYKPLDEQNCSFIAIAQAIVAMIIQNFKRGISIAGQRSTTMVIPLSLANSSAFASVTPS